MARTLTCFSIFYVSPRLSTSAAVPRSHCRMASTRRGCRSACSWLVHISPKTCLPALVMPSRPPPVGTGADRRSRDGLTEEGKEKQAMWPRQASGLLDTALECDSAAEAD